jgi:hypothetical protein
MSREARHYWGIRVVVVGGLLASLVTLWTIAIRQSLIVFNRTTDCGCAIAPLHWSTWMIIGTTLVGLATMYLTIRFGFEIGARIRRHRRVLQAALANGRVVWNHDVQTAIVVVPDSTAQAMTIGLVQPKVIVTDRLLRDLNRSEVASVLRHEQAHARSRDPLWSLLLESVGATLSWAVGLRTVVNTAFSLREIIADAVATANYTQARGLSGALYKLATATNPELVPAFSPNGDRITKLLNTKWELPVRWWSWRMIIAGVVVTAGLWFANGLPQATAAAQPLMATEACWLQEMICAGSPTHIILMSPEALMSKYGW